MRSGMPLRRETVERRDRERERVYREAGATLRDRRRSIIIVFLAARRRRRLLLYRHFVCARLLRLLQDDTRAPASWKYPRRDDNVFLSDTGLRPIRPSGNPWQS